MKAKVYVLLLILILIAVPFVSKAAAFNMGVDEVITQYKVQLAKEEELERAKEKARRNLMICELGFYSNNSGWVSPPEWYKEEIKDYSCRDKQVLTKVSWYESSWNPGAKNGWFEGLYQIGSGDTRDYVNSIGLYDDHEIAIWIYNNYPSWFESVTANSNSFYNL